MIPETPFCYNRLWFYNPLLDAWKWRDLTGSFSSYQDEVREKFQLDWKKLREPKPNPLDRRALASTRFPFISRALRLYFFFFYFHIKLIMYTCPIFSSPLLTNKQLHIHPKMYISGCICTYTYTECTHLCVYIHIHTHIFFQSHSYFCPEQFSL